MADYIVSADAGNGGTNVLMAKKNGGYKRFYEPSVRAIATGASLGLGDGFDTRYTYVDWYGNRYVTGDDVIRVRRGLERHMGANRYGDEFHQFLVANALARLGVKKGTVDLTLFAPPGLYNSVKDEMIDRFMEQDGVVRIQLKGDSKPREWQYSAVNVWPEGMGAALCFAVDDKGTIIDDSDFLAGEIVVLDAGAFTLDALKFIDGDYDAESLEYATWQNAGVNTHIREPLLRMLHQRGDDFSVLTVDDVDAVLRRGFMEDDFSLRVGGKEVDLETVVTNFSERYADWVANNIIDGVFNGLRGIKAAVLIGGGASMIAPKIEDLYGVYDPRNPNKSGKILNLKKHDMTKKVHPVDMNAVGGLRYAMMSHKQNDPG